ncbi:MAG: hypothetical protein CMC07_06060 [Flavobacteriaceae bacterium]|nr:hypothetical protein [Flavobacteriaceae bacterium]|tara:strand:- start:9049 stop:9774 length:726 start_codon:yes stop_codon:yes gene_type:complete
MEHIDKSIIEKIRNYPKENINEHKPIYVNCLLENDLRIENVTLKRWVPPLNESQMEQVLKDEKSIDDNPFSSSYFYDFEENNRYDLLENTIAIQNIVQMKPSNNEMSSEFIDALGDYSFQDEDYFFHYIFSVETYDNKWFNFDYVPPLGSYDCLLVMPNGYNISDVKNIYKDYVYVDKKLKKISEVSTNNVRFYGQSSSRFYCYLDFEDFVKKYDEYLEDIKLKEISDQIPSLEDDSILPF